MIPYNRQSINQQDIDSVIEVMNSPLLTQGQHIVEFEQGLKTYCSAPYAIAVSSGTAALHLACMALGVGPEDKVWTSSNSFVASANCARYCGAEIDFIDIDLNTGCICPQALKEKLKNTVAADLPSVIVVVDYAGHCADYKVISKLAKAFNFKIIQDASHSFGASYEGEKVGSAQYVDAVTFSFHPIKTMTTAEGGAILTRDEVIANQCKLLRTHGIERAASFDEPWLYQQEQLGFNYRLSDLHAALGISQLTRVDEFVARRQGILAQYNEQLDKLTLVTSQESSSSGHLASVLLAKGSDLDSIKKLYEYLKQQGINAFRYQLFRYMAPF